MANVCFGWKADKQSGAATLEIFAPGFSAANYDDYPGRVLGTITHRPRTARAFGMRAALVERIESSV